MEVLIIATLILGPAAVIQTFGSWPTKFHKLFTRYLSTMIYNSRQDFQHSNGCNLQALYCSPAAHYQVLGRTLASQNQADFEKYLHESMGWKRSTVDDWQAWLSLNPSQLWRVVHTNSKKNVRSIYSLSLQSRLSYRQAARSIMVC